MSRHKKDYLLNKITQAIYDDGWNLFFLSDPRYHPFRLHIYKGEENYRIKIYIWNMTHGGGERRPVDEYRIQITGIARFESEIGGETLILGWWEQGEVFAGFDFSRHTGPLGASPSIQIREEALRNAYINGFAPWRKENEEIAIAFRPDFFIEYVRNLESLHSFGESQTDYSALEEASQRPEEINQAAIENLALPRQTIIARVTRKVRENSFKARVLTAYGSRCAFCGMQLKLIEAAHIIPVSHEASTDETSNGLSLCSLHHRAYDMCLVTFNQQYQIIANEDKFEEFRELALDGGLDRFINEMRPIIYLPPAVNDRPHIENIRISNEIRGWNLN